MAHRLIPADPAFPADRFKVAVTNEEGVLLGWAGEVATDADGGWMALVPRQQHPAYLGGFRNANGAARWLVKRFWGSINPPPGFGPKARILEARRRRLQAWKNRWRREQRAKKRLAKLAAESKPADAASGPHG